MLKYNEFKVSQFLNKFSIIIKKKYIKSVLSRNFVYKQYDYPSPKINFFYLIHKTYLKIYPKSSYMSHNFLFFPH